MFVNLQRRIINPVMVILRALEHDCPTLECFRILRVGEIPVAEFLRNHACLHDRAVKQITLQHDKARILAHRLVDRENHVCINHLRSAAIIAHRLAVCCQRLLADQFFLHQFGDNRRHAARAVVFLSEILPCRLEIDEKRNLVADFLPVIGRQLHANMAGNRIDVDRRIRRSANGGIDDDRVLECLAGHDVGRLQIFPHHFNRTHAGFIRNLAALAIRRRNGRATR